MTTTDANGIAFVETTDSISPLQVLLNALQQSTSNAVTGLKAKDFVAQATAPAHVAGLRWFNTTTGVTSISDGTRWVGAGSDLVESSITSTVGPVGAGVALALVGTCFIDLTAGRWEVSAGASIRTPSGSVDSSTLGIYNVTTGAEVAGGRGNSMTSILPGTITTLSYPLVVNPTSTTRYCPVMTPNGSSTLQFSADAGGKSAWIRARRI